jgi:hypothetical protein
MKLCVESKWQCVKEYGTRGDTDGVLLAAADADGEVRRGQIVAGGGGGGAGGRLVVHADRAGAEASRRGAARCPCGRGALADAARRGASGEHQEKGRESAAAGSGAGRVRGAER